MPRPRAARPARASLAGLVLLVAHSADAAEGDKKTGPFGVIPPGYNSDEPPLIQLADGSNAMTPVVIGITLNKVLKVQLDSGVIDTSIWWHRYWYDPRLGFQSSRDGPEDLSTGSVPWNNTEHHRVVVSPRSIWKPDIELHERVDGFQERCALTSAVLLDDFGSAAVVDSFKARGLVIDDNISRLNVFWSQACQVTARCKMDLELFPFDRSRCDLTFMPWAESVYKLMPGPSVTDSRALTQQYSVQLSEGEITVLPSDNMPNGATQGTINCVTFHYDLNREWRYYLINYIIPVMLVLLLAWFAFYIPLDMGRSDRLAYTCTLLLTVMAVQFITADHLPAERVTMWIDKFQTMSLIGITIPILVTAVLVMILGRLAPIGDHTPEHQVHPEVVHERYRRRHAIHNVDRIMRVIYPACFAFVTVCLFAPPLAQEIWSTELALRIYRLIPEPIPLFLYFWAIVFMFLTTISWCNMWRQGFLLKTNYWSTIREQLIDDGKAYETLPDGDVELVKENSPGTRFSSRELTHGGWT